MSKKLLCLVSLVLVVGLANNASSQPTGEILIEWWLTTGSGNAVTDLTGLADFPDNPTGSWTLNILELPRTKPTELSALADDYGARLQGSIWPPASGDYTFWITGDNGSEFWLSTDADPANVVMMCEVPGTEWTDAREWAKFPNDQTSSAVSLKGGRAYYFDVLMKEGGGGDGVAVGWGGPTIGAGPVVIEGEYLSLPGEPIYSNAFSPKPDDEATDVSREVTLSWTPGEFAAPTNGHKVYFGESFDDVNDATGGVAQDANSYTRPQRLDFGTTYYWRVDEVNAPPTSHIEFKGRIWQFTTEPIAYAIENITATASSTHQADTTPENTINSLGLDVNDLHSTEPADMWLSGSGEPGSVWIEYEFDKVYKLHEMWVWNSNGMMEFVLGFGLKDVTIEYSTNGTDYTTLGTTHEFVRAPGADGYEHNTTVDFGGAAAKYVRLTANSNWGGFMPQYGLSEVRFFYIPVFAREPSPDSGATDVDVDVTLGFRAGREAVTHNVCLSTDEQAVIDGNAPVTTVTETSYGPLSLDLGTTYYWKINEVNEAETTTTWQGDIWNFTTYDYFVVDDFEDYNDYPPNEIWSMWIDGYGVPANGATVGYPDPDWNQGEHYVETAIVHGGSQAMPFFYSNTGGATYSEGERTFAVPQDWTKAGVQTLALHFNGSPGNTGQLYVKINGTKVPYDGQASNLALAGWQAWNIELASFGMDLQSVTTLGIGIDGNGASGTLYFDDISMYPYSRQFVTPVEPNNAGLIGHWKLDEGSGTIAQDSSGLGNDGTLGGNPQWVAGTKGGALDLDGIDDYVAIDGIADDITTNTFTVSAWIRTTQTGDGDVIGANHSGGDHDFVFGVDQGNLLVEADSVNLYPPAINDDQWHFIVYVRDGSTAYAYVDGALRGTETATGNPAGEDRWSIGQEWDSSDSSDPSDEYEGMVDDVRFYNYALSLGEVAWLAGRTEPFDKPF